MRLHYIAFILSLFSVVQLIYARPFTAKDKMEFTVSLDPKDISFSQARDKRVAYTLTVTPVAKEVSLKRVSLIVYEDHHFRFSVRIEGVPLLQDLFSDAGRELGMQSYFTRRDHFKSKLLDVDCLKNHLEDFGKWGVSVGAFEKGAFAVSGVELFKAQAQLALAKDPLLQDEDLFLKSSERLHPEFKDPVLSAAMALLATQPSYDESVFARKNLIFLLSTKAQTLSLEGAFALMDCLLCETHKPLQQELTINALPKLLIWAAPEHPLYLAQLRRLMAIAACRNDIPEALQVATTGSQLTSALFQLWIKKG